MLLNLLPYSNPITIPLHVTHAHMHTKSLLLKYSTDCSASHHECHIFKSAVASTTTPLFHTLVHINICIILSHERMAAVMLKWHYKQLCFK